LPSMFPVNKFSLSGTLAMYPPFNVIIFHYLLPCKIFPPFSPTGFPLSRE
jgi:hypothetical protein